MKDEFVQDSKTTIGVEFTAKMINTSDGKKIKAQIWDTAGEEKYKSVTNTYFRGAVGAFLIYDITSKRSFDLIPDWLDKIQDNGGTEIVIMLVGNKTDLEPQREVTTEQGQKYAQKNGLAFIETSAKDGNNVELAFNTIIIRKFNIIIKF